MLLINKIFLAIGSTAAAVVVLTIFGLSLANARLKMTLAQEQVKTTACMIANDDFAQRLTQQKAAVEKIKADGAAREARAHEAAEASQEKARRFYVAADTLRKTKIGGEACKAADALLNEYLEGLR